MLVLISFWSCFFYTAHDPDLLLISLHAKVSWPLPVHIIHIQFFDSVNKNQMKKIRMWISIGNDHFGYSLFIYLFTVGVSTCNITSSNRVDIKYKCCILYTISYIHRGYMSLKCISPGSQQCSGGGCMSWQWLSGACYNLFWSTGQKKEKRTATLLA